MWSRPSLGPILFFLKPKDLKPIVDNPLIIGDWPYYYIGFEILAVANIILFYYMFRKLTKNKESVLVWKKIVTFYLILF